MTFPKYDLLPKRIFLFLVQDEKCVCVGGGGGGGGGGGE